MAGRIALSIQVAADGSVSRATGHRTGNLDDTVVRCVLDTALSLHFDPPAGGLAVVRVPVTFVPNKSTGGSSARAGE